MSTSEHRNALPSGYRLQWYHIEKILGQGGFGITYLATDTNLNCKVAIKEYLPVEMAVRQDNTSIHPVSGEHGEQFTWGLERFITEAQTLARFKHPNIVRVLTVFRENNTAYMIMEYEQGCGLQDILKERKTLDEKYLKAMLVPVLDGLESVHRAGFVHRDIKPANIYIRDDNSPVLIDFGSARQSLAGHTRTLTTLVSPGYAPFEQYVSNSKKQGPWTDIYGLAATLYRSVTGISPPDSMNRSEALLHTGKDIFVSSTEIAGDKYSPAFLSAIDHAMAFKPEDRPQSVSDWRLDFEHSLAVTPPTAGNPQTETVALTGKTVVNTVKPAAAGESGFGKWLKWGFAVILVVVIAGMLGERKKHAAVVEDTSPAEVKEEQQVNTDMDSSRLDANKTDSPEQPVPIAKEIMDQPAQITDEKTEQKPENMVPVEDRQAIKQARDRVIREPENRMARRDMAKLGERIEQKVREAVKNRNYDLAEDYLEEILQYAPNDSPKRKEMLDMLEKIRERKIQAARE